MDAALIGRVKTRYLEGEKVPKDEAIAEAIVTVQDRLKIRLGTMELPETAGSIVVDASMKALRLRGYEGSTNESSSDGGSISNSFVDNILAEYADEIDALYRSLHRGGIQFI